MGTRVNYELSDAEAVTSSIILFANNSHPGEDPDAVFMDIMQRSATLSQAVIALLQASYQSNGGNHKAGQAMFTVDLEPFDYEYRLVAQLTGVFQDAIGEVSFVKINDDNTFEAITPSLAR